MWKILKIKTPYAQWEATTVTSVSSMSAHDKRIPLLLFIYTVGGAYFYFLCCENLQELCMSCQSSWTYMCTQTFGLVHTQYKKPTCFYTKMNLLEKDLCMTRSEQLFIHTCFSCSPHGIRLLDVEESRLRCMLEKHCPLLVSGGRSIQLAWVQIVWLHSFVDRENAWNIIHQTECWCGNRGKVLHCCPACCVFLLTFIICICITLLLLNRWIPLPGIFRVRLSWWRCYPMATSWQVLHCRNGNRWSQGQDGLAQMSHVNQNSQAFIFGSFGLLPFPSSEVLEMIHVRQDTSPRRKGRCSF